MTFDYDTAALKRSWGIYSIGNRQSRRLYIGSTAHSFWQRWRVHWKALDCGKHENAELQMDWLSFGSDSFEFRILESYTGKPISAWAEHREAVLIAQSNGLYNQQVPGLATLRGYYAKRLAKAYWLACYGSVD